MMKVDESKFTGGALMAIRKAEAVARREGHHYVSTWHLIAGTREVSPDVDALLSRNGCSSNRYSSLQPLPVDAGVAWEMSAAESVDRAVKLATGSLRTGGKVEVLHLVCAAFQDPTLASGFGLSIVRREVLANVESLLRSAPKPPPIPKPKPKPAPQRVTIESLVTDTEWTVPKDDSAKHPSDERLALAAHLATFRSLRHAVRRLDELRSIAERQLSAMTPPPAPLPPSLDDRRAASMERAAAAYRKAGGTLLDDPADRCEYPPRISSALRRLGLTSFRDLVTVTESEFRDLRNVGEGTTAIAKERLRALGLAFKPEPDPTE